MNEHGSTSAPVATVACDLTTGQCGDTAAEAPVRATVHYITDPICSACWALEPAWRALTFHYGDVLDVRHVHGGLLPGWEGFSDPGAGIRGPADVAHHWDEIAVRTGQPINSRVWHDDPLASSFPASVAVIAVRLLDPALEETYLRRLREALFVDARNIARREVQLEVAEAVGVRSAQLEAVLADGSAAAAFENDLRLARRLGVRGFPTLIFESGPSRLSVGGTQPLAALERTLLAVTGSEPRRRPVSVTDAVAHLGTASTLEYAVLLERPTTQVPNLLRSAGLQRVNVGAGEMWRA